MKLRRVRFLPLVFAAVSALSPAYGSPTCQDAFEPPKFPPGFKLNPHDFGVGLRIPEMRSFLLPLKEAIEAFESSSQYPGGALLLHRSYVPNEETRLRRLANLPKRDFPEEFFQTFLASKVTDADDLRKQYDRLHHVVGRPELSPEGLLILTYVATKLPGERTSLFVDGHTHAVTVDVAGGLPVFIDRMGSRLPSIRDFFASGNPNFFIELAVASRLRNIEKLPELSRTLITRSTEDYRRLLKLALVNSKGPMSLEEKVEIARALTEDLVQEYGDIAYSILLAPRTTDLRNIEKWQRLGVPYLKYLIADAFKVDKLYYTAEDFIGEMDRYLLELTDGQPSEQSKFIREAFKSVIKVQAHQASPEVAKAKARITTELTALAVDARKAIQDLEKARRSAGTKALEGQIANQQKGAVVVASKKKQGQGSNISRSMRQAMSGQKTKQEQERAAKQAQERAAEQAKALMPTEQRLRDLAARGAEAISAELIGQRFWFEKIGPVSESEGVPEQGRVQYVEFEKKFIDDIVAVHRGGFAAWIKAFLVGPVSANASSGLKKLLKARKRDAWEIKIADSDYRVIVEHLKKPSRWVWLGIVHHNDVDNFIVNNNL